MVPAPAFMRCAGAVLCDAASSSHIVVRAGMLSNRVDTPTTALVTAQAELVVAIAASHTVFVVFEYWCGARE